MIIDSQAVKNTCNASAASNGFCFYKATNGRNFAGRSFIQQSFAIKRHLAVDSLGFPFFTHCTRANVSDDQGLIEPNSDGGSFSRQNLAEMLSQNIDYFRQKPVELPKTTILLDHGYHPETIQRALEQIYPAIMTKVRFEVSAKLSKAEKAAEGKSGFVPIAVRWIIERTAMKEGFPP